MPAPCHRLFVALSHGAVSRPPAHEPAAAFDCDDNGRIDVVGVVRRFNRL